MNPYRIRKLCAFIPALTLVAAFPAPSAHAGPPNAEHVGQAPPPAAALPGKGTPVPVAAAPVLAKEIKARKGKVLLINYWATWCGPCVAEFPQIVKFYNAYQGKGLDVLAISGDFGKKRDGAVTAFKQQQKANFSFFLMPEGDATAYINAIDPAWQGDLPRTYLIDRQGRVRQKIEGEINAPQLEATLKKLLAEKPTATAATPAKTKSLLGG